jgi:hypothetical protein
MIFSYALTQLGEGSDSLQKDKLVKGDNLCSAELLIE